MNTLRNTPPASSVMCATPPPPKGGDREASAPEPTDPTPFCTELRDTARVNRASFTDRLAHSRANPLGPIAHLDRHKGWQAAIPAELSNDYNGARVCTTTLAHTRASAFVLLLGWWKAWAGLGLLLLWLAVLTGILLVLP